MVSILFTLCYFCAPKLFTFKKDYDSVHKHQCELRIDQTSFVTFSFIINTLLIKNCETCCHQIVINYTRILFFFFPQTDIHKQYLSILFKLIFGSKIFFEEENLFFFYRTCNYYFKIISEGKSKCYFFYMKHNPFYFLFITVFRTYQ